MEEIARLLLVEGDSARSSSIIEMLSQAGGPPIGIVVADSLRDAVEALEASSCRLILLGDAHPDGTAALEALQAVAPSLPVIVFGPGGAPASPPPSSARRGRVEWIDAAHASPRELAAAVRHAMELGGIARALDESERRYRTLADACGAAVLLESGGRVVFANRMAGELFAAGTPEPLAGRRRADLFAPSAGDPGGTVQAMSPQGGGDSATDLPAARSECTYRGAPAMQWVVRPGAPAVEREPVAAFRPEGDLRDDSSFRELVERAIAGARPGKQTLALLLLEVDGPDGGGERAGAAALEEVAVRLRNVTRKGDTLARLGNARFAMLVEALPEARLAAIVAERQLRTVSNPAIAGPARARITASIGIGVLSPAARDADKLLEHASLALQDARTAGGNEYRFHDVAADGQSAHDEPRTAGVAGNLARLTSRERQVLDMLVAGKSSKMIAYLLGTSTRTIDAHRARVMEKMKAGSLAALVRMVVQRASPRAATGDPPGARQEKP